MSTLWPPIRNLWASLSRALKRVWEVMARYSGLGLAGARGARTDGRMLWGLPLIHVNVGLGIRKAKGIIAIGTIARGIVALGAISMGVISLGAISIGVLALGALALGIIAAAGFAFGGIAVGGIAVGFLAIGGVALGQYSLGGYASALHIAKGGYAQGHIAIGNAAKGEYAWQKISELTRDDYAVIRDVILKEFPGIWRWLLGIFVG